MMLLMRILEALLGGGVMVAALAAWRLCSPSSSRRLRVLGWVVAAAAACGVVGFFWAAALKVSLRTALRGHALVNAASPVLQAAIVSGIIVLAGGWVLSFIRLGIPRFRAGSTSNLKYEAVSLTVCVALLVTSLELPVQDRRLSTPEQRIAQLDRSLRALEDGERALPRDTWDPDYVVKMVGRDPQRLFRWVQNNTYWIPYHGVLRGPVGVLMDRQGNSLDRAVLLAKLLQRAGYSVRLAHGQLTQKQALDVLPNLEAARFVGLAPELTPEYEQHGRLAAVRRQGDGATDDSAQSPQQVFTPLLSELRSRVADQTERLLKLIPHPNSDELLAREFGSAIAAVTDHWWVQVRSGANWVNLDLVTDRPGAEAVAAHETYAIKELPSALHHTVTMRVIAEQWSGGTLTEHKTLEQVLRPSDLYGHTVMLQFWPSEWVSKDNAISQHSRAGALAQEQWDSVLAVDNHVLQGGLLLANGDDPTAAVKGGAFGGLAGAFASSMGQTNKSDNHQLSAVWLEYEVHVPGEKPRTIRRAVFDLLGPAARATASPQLALDDSKRLARSFLLTMKTEILPMAGGLSPEFVAALYSQNMATDRDLFAFLLKGDLPTGLASTDQLFRRLAPPLSTLYALALARMELSQKGLVFIDRPNILTRHLYAAPAGDAIALLDATDIVANEVGIGLMARDPFAARLAQGVLDTNAESMLQLGQNIAVSAGDAFAASRSWRGFASGDDAAAVNRISLSEDVRRQLGTDLSAGYSVVAPEHAVPMSSGDFAGWWRIDPATGAALGMDENGWGGDAAEDGLLKRMVANIAATWKQRLATFAVAFSINYAWCVAPLVQKHVNKYVEQRSYEEMSSAATTGKLQHSLGIWEGAIKPIAKDSVGECTLDSIIVGGITAIFLPVGVAYETSRMTTGRTPHVPEGEISAGGSAGGSGSAGRGGGGKTGRSPKGNTPHEPGDGPNEPNQPNDDPPKKDEPCPDGGEVSPGAKSVEPQPAAKPTGSGAGSAPTAQDVVNEFNEYVAAQKAMAESAAEVVRYLHRRVNVPGRSTYDPNLPGPADYDPAVEQQLEAKSQQAEQTWEQVGSDYLKDWTDYMKANHGQDPFQAAGVCGGDASGGGPPQAIDSLDPALYENPGTGNAQPGLGPPDPITDPNGPPTVRDPRTQVPGDANNPFADTQPLDPMTDPNGPPTIRDPQGQFDDTQSARGNTQPMNPQGPSGAQQPSGTNPNGPVGQSGSGNGSPGQSWDDSPCDWCGTAVPNWPDTSSSNDVGQTFPPPPPPPAGAWDGLTEMWKQFYSGGGQSQFRK